MKLVRRKSRKCFQYGLSSSYSCIYSERVHWSGINNSFTFFSFDHFHSWRFVPTKSISFDKSARMVLKRPRCNLLSFFSHLHSIRHFFPADYEMRDLILLLWNKPVVQLLCHGLETVKGALFRFIILPIIISVHNRSSLIHHWDMW